MPIKYSLAIHDPWNMNETEDFDAETPFQAFSVGDEVDTRHFGTKAKRGRARVTKVIRTVGHREAEGIVYDHTRVETEAVD